LEHKFEHILLLTARAKNANIYVGPVILDFCFFDKVFTNQEGNIEKLFGSSINLYSKTELRFALEVF